MPVFEIENGIIRLSGQTVGLINQDEKSINSEYSKIIGLYRLLSAQRRKPGGTFCPSPGCFVVVRFLILL